MARSRKEDVKSKGERQQVILRLVQEHPISRQEVLLDHLSKEGFEVTQATVSRDIRELCLVKAATAEGYRYVSSRNESFNPKTQGRDHLPRVRSGGRLRRTCCAGKVLFWHGQRRMRGF